MRRWLYCEYWWAVHNLLAHPLLQLCWWASLCGRIAPLARLGDWLHEVTTPVEETVSLSFSGLDSLPDWLVIDAVRYVIGRTSVQADETSLWLVEHWDRLPERVRQQVRRDLEREFERDDRARAEGRVQGLPLGWNCDRLAWERVRKLWATEQVP